MSCSGHGLIPERTPEQLPPDLSRHGQTLIEHYGLANSRAAATEGHVDVAAAMLGADSGLVEIIIPPRSILIGTHVFAGMVAGDGELVILAIRRNGEELTGPETQARGRRHDPAAGHVGGGQAARL